MTQGTHAPTTTENQAPPGWHPDPNRPGQLRWWDGNTWTDQYRPVPSTVAKSAAAGRPWWKRTWVLAVAMFLLGFTLAAASSSGQSSEVASLRQQVKDLRAQVDQAKQQAKEATANGSAQADAAKQAADDAKQAADKQVKDKVAALDKRESAVAKRERAVAQREQAADTAETAAEANTFPGDGTFLVGKDIKAGTYRASASAGCYWARLRDLNGGVNSIIDNNNTDGPVVLQVRSSDKAVEVSGCSDFHKM